MLIKRLFLIITLFLSVFSFTINSFAQSTTQRGEYNYVPVSSFDGSQDSVHIKEDKDAIGLGTTFNYLLTFMGVVIVILIIFRLLQGAFLKGTYDNIYSQRTGNKSIKIAGTALIIFISAYAVLSFINPDLTGWSVATDYISTVREGGSGGGGGATGSWDDNKCSINPSYSTKSVEDQIKYDEERGEFHPNVYLDQKNKATIGWGFNLTQDGAKNTLKSIGLDEATAQKLVACTQGDPTKTKCPLITQKQADDLFNIHLEKAKKEAARFAGSETKFNSLPENVQKVLINMSYNMGSFTDFPSSGDTSQGLQNKDWNRMAKGIQESKYCGDVQDRCGRMVGLILGKCPEVNTNSGSLANSPLTKLQDFINPNQQCPANTTDLGVIQTKYRAIRNNQYPSIRLCKLSSVKGKGENGQGKASYDGAIVNSTVAEYFQKMGEAALNSNPKIQLSANSSFRLNDSCGGTGNGGGCATPGASPHQLGIAIDFANSGNSNNKTPDGSLCNRRASVNTATYKWLKENADNFSIKQYAVEPWHWDLYPSTNRC